MTLDVSLALQAGAATALADATDLGDAATPADAAVGAFAAVFAQLMPVVPGGQNLAAEPHLSTGPAATQEGADSLDPAVAWIHWPGPPPAWDTASGLQSQSLGSGQMQLVTPAQVSPEAQGDALMAFAQGQGLDESAMKRLFGPELIQIAPKQAPAMALPAAAWIAQGPSSWSVNTPVVAPEVVPVDAHAQRMAVERTVLTFLPTKRLTDPSGSKTAAPADQALVVGEDGRVELDLDVGAMIQEMAPEADLKALKAEERTALSLRIGEILAQRMLAQAQRGHWQLRFALNPQNLGRVEIDMQMRGGELEASFGAMNPATRELLQEALPRLRDLLQQSGMDVASLNIGSGGASKNGGHSTPTDQPPRVGASEGENTQPEASARPQRPAGADGWDIWV